MSDEETPVHRPFGGFRVTTEPMPDGRRIHYYEWPAEGGHPPDAAGSDTEPARDDAAAVGDGDE